MKFWRSEGRHGDYNEQHVTSAAAAAAAQSRQSRPTLCDPIDGSPPGSPVPGILQARTLEWVAISFSNAWKWKGKVKSLSPIWLLATPWTAAYQAPPSMGFPRQEHWSGVPLPLCTSNLQKEYNLSFHTHTHNYVSWWMCDLTWLWWSFHNAYIYQIITWYTLNIYSLNGQWYLNKTGAKERECKESHFQKTSSKPAALVKWIWFLTNTIYLERKKTHENMVFKKREERNWCVSRQCWLKHSGPASSKYLSRKS